MTGSGHIDFLKNLVTLVIILTAVATVIALVLYFWAIAPVQKMEQLSPPTN